MRFSNDPPPRRLRETEDPLEGFEAYIKLRAAVAHASVKPFETVGLYIFPEDAKKLGMKDPHRAVYERVRKMIKDMGLESEYRVFKQVAPPPAGWYVGVENIAPVHNVKTKKTS
jgi:hypothetical protein